MPAADHRAPRARHGVYKAAQLVGEPPYRLSRADAKAKFTLCCA
jgi:hypothetical protein